MQHAEKQEVSRILPDQLLRLEQVIGTDRARPRRLQPKSGGRQRVTERPWYPGVVPMSRTAWWAGVAAGTLPQPVKLGPATTCWRGSDILALIAGTWQPQPPAPTTKTNSKRKAA